MFLTLDLLKYFSPVLEEITSTGTKPMYRPDAVVWGALAIFDRKCAITHLSPNLT